MPPGVEEWWTSRNCELIKKACSFEQAVTLTYSTNDLLMEYGKS